MNRIDRISLFILCWLGTLIINGFILAHTALVPFSFTTCVQLILISFPIGLIFFYVIRNLPISVRDVSFDSSFQTISFTIDENNHRVLFKTSELRNPRNLWNYDAICPMETIYFTIRGIDYIFIPRDMNEGMPFKTFFNKRRERRHKERQSK